MNNNGWTNALFALIFLAIPGFIFIFWIFNFDNIDNNLLVQIGLAFGYLIYGILFSFIVVKIDWLNLDSLTFNIPITIVFASIMATNEGPIWLVVVMAFVGIFSTIPVNIFIGNFKKRRRK